MKDNKNIQSFGQFNENLNISDVSVSKLQKLEEYLKTRIEELSFDDTHDTTEWKLNKREKDVLRYIRDTFIY